MNPWVSAQLVSLRRWLVGLPRAAKRTVLVLNDFMLLSLALWAALSLRYNELFVPPDAFGFLVLLAAPAIGVATLGWFGLYRLVTRYIGSRGTSQLLLCICLSVLVWAMLVLLVGATWVPRTVVAFLYPFLAAAVVYASRQAAAALLRGAGVALPVTGRDIKAVVIYGAGTTGVQLLEALQRSGEARVAGLLDPSPTLWGQYARGVKIYPPEKLTRLIERENVREVVLALPESQRRERQRVLKEIEHLPVRVKTLPAIEDFATGRATVSDLRPVDVEDLLGREPVPPDPELLSRNIRGKAVMVTGAGGSIGSELVRQIIRQGPSRIVLLELSEAALYEIDMEAAELIAALPPGGPKPIVVSVLGSVLDEALVRRAISEQRIATIYHAAAYKHVPIVEQNPAAGLANNTFGTRVVAEAARELAVERMVLISTDKAVRPSSIMGGSKRLAELILQAHAADPSCRTVFTMVRFGNVLDSSGSVVRRFRKQIQAGGPVTVTHPEVIRYFMSIPEAATLVLQAGAMATGGEVFVLDMGEPVKIDDLARSMVRLMGLDVRDEANPDGDIAIVYTGLRPGEKLYEELLLGDDTTATEHPRIRRSSEPHLALEALERELALLQSAMTSRDSDALHAVLQRTVEGYRPEAQASEAPPPPRYVPATRTLH
ncbi:MAG TPA: nucleoside-diphosphate sugar epimerase/dehydratase [Hyphomicrobiaceae bacterium]|nr:nucleoside-diphosphate sugar epimerase/dehydratase [Hyphomicrobiaceae bacterium]